MQITNKHHRLLGLAIVVLGLFFLGRWIFTPGHVEAQPSAVLIRAATVVRQDIPIKVDDVGLVVPYQSVNINARLDSQILKVPFNSGAEVKKGQVLFVLDDRTLKAQLRQAEAALARDVAQLSNLQWTFQRNKTLFQKHTISEQVFEASKAAVDAQEAVILSDKAAIDSLHIQLGYTLITSPIPGRAGTLNVTAGNNVKANDITLVTVNQIKPIWVQASLPQRTFDKIIQAMQKAEVPVFMEKEGRPVEKGILQYVNNTVDNSTGTFVVRALFKNEKEALWPGMLVRLSFHLGLDQQALVIPEAAIQQNSAGAFVFVIANNRAQKRPVTLARTQEGLAIIETGLKEKEQVAIDGLMSLKNGVLVQIQKEEQHAGL